MPPHVNLPRVKLSPVLGRSSLAAIAAAYLIGHCAQASVVSWTNIAGGDFNTSANWSGGIPTALDTALFDISLSGNVTLSSGVTPGSISFDANANTFSVGTAGGSTMTMANNGSISVLSTLLDTNKTFTINAPIVLTPASPTTAGAYTIQNNASSPTNTLVIAGGISSSTTTSSQTLTLDGANTGNNLVSGNITNGGATTFAVTKNGAGTWTLSGNNTFTGGLTVKGGTLISNSSGSGTALGIGNVTVQSGGTLVGNAKDAFGWLAGQSPALLTIAGGTVTTGTNGNYNVALPNITFDGGGTLSSGLGNTGDGASNIAFYAGNAATATVNVINPGATTALISATKIKLQASTTTIFNVARGTAAADLSITGQLVGNTSLTKDGDGIMVLSNIANNFSGGVIVKNGTLISTSSAGTSALGKGNITVQSGGTLVGNAKDAFGWLAGQSPALLTIAGGTVTTGTNGNYAVALPNITFDGGGTLSSGLGNAGDGTNNMSFYAGNAATATVNVINPGATTALISATKIKLQASTTTIFNVARGTAAADLSITGQLVGTTSLTKSGAGIMVLSGSNTYTGATIINGGKLAVNGSLAAASAVTVNNGGTLGGSGTVHNVIVGTSPEASGAILAPGNGSFAGTLTADNVTFSGTDTHFSIQLGNTTHSSLTTLGLLTLNGAALDIALEDGYNPAEGTILTIANNQGSAVSGFFTYNGTLLGQGAEFSVNGQTFAISYNADLDAESVYQFTKIGGNDIALRAIPEPQTWISLLGGLGMLALRQRVRRSNRDNVG